MFRNAIKQLRVLNPSGLVTKGSSEVYSVIDGKIVGYDADGQPYPVNLEAPDMIDYSAPPSFSNVVPPPIFIFFYLFLFANNL